MKLKDALLVSLFPRRCAFCGDMVAFDMERCPSCRAGLPVIEAPVCLHCGHSKADCTCKGKKLYYEAVVAPYYYTDSAARALQNFKFGNMPFLAENMAADMAKCIKTFYCTQSFDLVTEVPVGKKRLRRRGYDQSALLARELARHLNVPYCTLLQKVVNNKEQHRQKAADRRANVYGAYKTVRRADLRGKRILLVDDVKTTGATLDECAKMLLLADAASVSAAVFAITKITPRKAAEASMESDSL